MEQQVERPQLKIEPKREMLAKYGVTLPQFGDIVNVMLGGEAVSQVYEENRSFDLTLKVNDASRASAERIRKLIVDANGRKVPLENIANVTSSMGLIRLAVRMWLVRLLFQPMLPVVIYGE